MLKPYVKEIVEEIRKDKPSGVPVHIGTQTPLGEKTVTIENLVKAVSDSTGEKRGYIIKVILAVYCSIFLRKKDPIWLMIVGNPSSNKTTLVDLLKSAPDTYRLDTMTANPFSSGQRAKENPQDLLPLLDEKCFIMKEYATVFGRSDEMVKQLISDLVAIYDGEYAKHSPTRGTVRYKAIFSHIGCVTPMGLNSRQKYMNSVGARFLFLRIPELNDSERDEGLDSLIVNSTKESKNDACEIVRIFCEQLKEKARKKVEIKFSKEVKKRLKNLANLIARARGIVVTERVSFQNETGNTVSHYETVDIQVEEPFRAMKQLMLLAKSLTMVNEKAICGEEELEILHKIAFSSMPVRRADILKVFNFGESFSAKLASDKLKKNQKTVKRIFDELVALRILDSHKKENELARIYTLKKEFSNFRINDFQTESPTIEESVFQKDDETSEPKRDEYGTVIGGYPGF